MTKPVVRYDSTKPAYIKLGLCARVTPLDHPNPHGLVTNTTSILTSQVESYDSKTGWFTTRNTLYRPDTAIYHNLVYLAAPYTDPDSDVVEGRMRLLALCDAKLMEQGVHTMSPLLKHLLRQHTRLPGDWNYWGEYSKNALKRCDKMIVLMIDGWEKSFGVQGEIEIANELGISVEFVAPESLLTEEEAEPLSGAISVHAYKATPPVAAEAIVETEVETTTTCE